MRKFVVIFSLVLMTYLIACSKNESSDVEKPAPVVPTVTTLPSKAETKSQYDNTNFGVYKGVIIGSTGIIVFYINNENNVVKCYLSIDNKKDTLNTTAKIVLGQPIVDVLFTGKFSSVVINADKNGKNATLSKIKIDGHNNVESYIEHEKSTSQIKCYEGTMTGDLTGTFNCIRFGSIPDTVYSIIKFAGNDTTYKGFGGNEATSAYPDTLALIISRPLTTSFVGSIGATFYGDTLKGIWRMNFGSRPYKGGKVTAIRTY